MGHEGGSTCQGPIKLEELLQFFTPTLRYAWTEDTKYPFCPYPATYPALSLSHGHGILAIGAGRQSVTAIFLADENPSTLATPILSPGASQVHHARKQERGLGEVHVQWVTGTN